MRILVGPITTVDATSTNQTIAPISADSTVCVSATIIARAAGGTSSVWTATAIVKRVGTGAAQMVGTPVTSLLRDSVLWTATLGVSGSNLIVTVVGQATTVIKWSISAEIAVG